ncbi:YebG family protein [Rheinheimera sp.]|uniref:YebG family protein n=1 Tax=Rheinheimera sp. TaxID=1869214 RepID=UPI003525A952
MAVIIKYVVERNGAEKMTFTSKAEADAYDKMLDTADELTHFLAASTLIADEQLTEALALYMAQQKDNLLVALGAKKPAVKADKVDKTEKAAKTKIAAVEQAA